ncbi:hypothetical protein BH09MYX1_BH09MYX1_38670 [soil metagenome]
MSSMLKFERGFAAAAFDGIFPRDADPRLPQGAADGDMVGLFEDARSRVPPRVALGLRVAVWIVALAPLLTIGKFATIAGLATSDRERVVVALLGSNFYIVRQLTTLLKAFGALFFLTFPGVRKAIVRAPERAVELGASLVSLSKKGASHERSVA